MVEVPRPGRRSAAAVVIALLCGLGCVASTAGAKATWLCRPGLAKNPCTPGLATTTITPSGAIQGTTTPAAGSRAIDCFYVYPTVSNQPLPAATRRIDPEERSIALYQAARYSSECRVFAPMYRQITLSGLLTPKRVTPAIRAAAYRDVRDAWRQYLAKDNKGRGVVFIGHSQGSFVLRRLLAEEVDPKPAVRRRLVSALLLGGNVVVRQGQDAGGDFKAIPACRAPAQVGCVVAFSTYDATPPADTLFGRPARQLGVGPKTTAGLEVLCTNPAALGGGAAPITPIYPSRPFAPATTIGALTRQLGFPVPAVTTPWLQADGAYTAQCSSEGGANVLLLSPAEGAPALRPLPSASWGLHLADANIALGNLIDLVRAQAAAYAAR